MELEKISMEISELQKIKFSVLMSVYKKENPEWFRLAVDSIVNQTVQPAEVVIVQDGELTRELYEVCDELLNKYPTLIRYLSLTNNCGLGIALQQGVLACKYDLIARMDTDDISYPNRFELQLKEFADDPFLSLCGGFIEEFSDNPLRINSIRNVPLEDDNIKNFCKRRNPFNHMTVMFNKKDVLDVGNYQPFLLMEDYFLWYRMIKNGKKVKNISKVLVKARIGNGMIARRGGVRYYLKECSLYKKFYKDGYINYCEYLCSLIIRLVGRMMPTCIRSFCYRRLLR